MNFVLYVYVYHCTVTNELCTLCACLPLYCLIHTWFFFFLVGVHADFIHMLICVLSYEHMFTCLYVHYCKVLTFYPSVAASAMGLTLCNS